ncbi:GAF and ANTAR domain-containing protein [Actinomycetospora sp. TBRC 11914]|uniref:GAF and ANTAR domain-containing protein n=1 Tax=Actinomycetospora sp. TBRC 11914 TaxID=2729387 RepID=UPI00289C5CB8|nr:GAF and ANTAR domain-containing protein [Actinomycetospora sp. TBRC 11914]
MADPHRSERLLGALRAAARELMDRRTPQDLEELLARIVVAAVETVPGADAGGISMSGDDEVTSRGPSRPSVSQLDRLQGALHEGPCISAIDEPAPDGIVLADDLAGDDAGRWPRFTAEAAEAGYRSVVSVQLSQEPGTASALNLYARAPGVFDADARLTAGIFGVQAAALIHGAEQARHLQAAVDARDVVGQAKGILMERFTVHGDEAFQMLVTSSNATELTLVDVASWLVGEAEDRRRRGGDTVEER